MASCGSTGRHGGPGVRLPLARGGCPSGCVDELSQHPGVTGLGTKKFVYGPAVAPQATVIRPLGADDGGAASVALSTQRAPPANSTAPPATTRGPSTPPPSPASAPPISGPLPAAPRPAGCRVPSRSYRRSPPSTPPPASASPGATAPGPAGPGPSGGPGPRRGAARGGPCSAPCRSPSAATRPGPPRHGRAPPAAPPTPPAARDSA